MNQISWPWLPWQIEKTTVYLLFSIFIQFSAIEIRWFFSHTKLTISWFQWLEKRWGACARWWARAIFSTDSSISRQIHHLFNVSLHECVLNDAINYAQKGCAMQLWGIILRKINNNYQYYASIKWNICTMA